MFRIGFELEELPIFADPGFLGWESCPALVVFEFTFFLRYNDFLPFTFDVAAKLTSFYFYLVVFRLWWVCMLSLSVFVWWLWLEQLYL